MNKNGELKHHGVLGMRWGIRKDEKRGSRNSSSLNKGDNFSVKSMSNEQLREVVNRLQLERQLRELTREDTKKGSEWVGAVKNGLKTTVTAAAAAASLYILKSAIEKRYGIDVVSEMFPSKKKKKKDHDD